MWIRIENSLKGFITGNFATNIFPYYPLDTLFLGILRRWKVNGDFKVFSLLIEGVVRSSRK